MNKNLLLIVFLISFIPCAFSQAPLWVIDTGAPLNETITDSDGNIYAHGVFEGTVDMDPGPGVFNLTADGPNDIFIVKYDADGNFIWARAIITDNDDGIYEMDIYNDTLYLLGYLKHTVNFDVGISDFSLSASNDYVNVFVAKFSKTNGNFLWAGQLEGDSENFKTWSGAGGLEITASLLIDPDQGDYYIGGILKGTIDFDFSSEISQESSIGYEDAFLVKYTEDNSLLWVKTYGKASKSVVIDELQYDSQNNIIVAGSVFGQDFDVDPGPDEFLISSAFYHSANSGYPYDNSSVYFSKFDPHGNFITSEFIFKGTQRDAGISRLVLDSNDNMISILYGDHWYVAVNSTQIHKFNSIQKNDASTNDVIWQVYNFYSNNPHDGEYRKVFSNLEITSNDDFIYEGESYYFSYPLPYPRNPLLTRRKANIDLIYGGEAENSSVFYNSSGNIVEEPIHTIHVANNDQLLMSGSVTISDIDLDISNAGSHFIDATNYTNYLVKYDDFVADHDYDNDGVANNDDQCQNTPPDEIPNVDTNGCAGGDSDNDGIDDNVDVFLTTPTDMDVCDINNDTLEVVDLTIKENEILNGEDPSLFTIRYHESLSDAQNNDDPITDPVNYTNSNNPQPIYILVKRNSSDAYDITNFNINLLEVPDGIPQTLVACDPEDDGTTVFDLTENESIISNGSTDFAFTYYLTEADAQAETNAITNPTSYTNLSVQQRIYMLAVYTITGCSRVTSFELLPSAIVCQFELPSDNFTIQALGESCSGVDNGLIIINAVANYNYVATLTFNGSPYTIPNGGSFTNDLNISGLQTGNYELCIAIPSEGYNTCFDLFIDAPQNLTGSSNTEENLYSLILTGSEVYHIDFNNTEITLNSASANEPLIFQRTLTQSNNTIKVTTPLSCQGIYEEVITMDEANFVRVLPNPVTDYLDISVVSEPTIGMLHMYDASGKLLLAKEVNFPLSNFKLNMSNFNSGIYFLNINTSNLNIKRKVIKK